MSANLDKPTEHSAVRTKPHRKRVAPGWERVFFGMVRRYGTIRRACTAAKVGRRTVQDRLKKDEAFARAFARACEDARERRLEAAQRRALKGEGDRPPSDRLLCKLIDRDDRLAAQQAPRALDPRGEKCLDPAMPQIVVMVQTVIQAQQEAQRKQVEALPVPPAAPDSR